jgi:threonyl-tRNA synthetase
MAKVLENWDVASLYPNLVRIYGYSSRNQKDKQAYIDLLAMRIKAKHGELGHDILKPLNLTNKQLNKGLKLPLNAYT